MLLYGSTRRVDPHMPVEVSHDGEWCEGWLEAWRQDEDGWRAYVRYKADVGMTYLTWVNSDDLRPL